MEKLIYCDDSCFVALIARTNESNKWDLYGLSRVPRIGSPVYDKKLFDFDFIDVVPLGYSEVKAYVCLNKNNKWGLMEVRNNGTGVCDWRMAIDFIYENMDALMAAF